MRTAVTPPSPTRVLTAAGGLLIGLTVLVPSRTRAAHRDLYLVADDTRVVTGLYDWARQDAEAPHRVVLASTQYTTETTAHTSNPGFTALESGLTSFDGLPGAAQASVRFVPLTVPNGPALGLAYAEVEDDPEIQWRPPADVTLRFVDPWGIDVRVAGAEPDPEQSSILIGETTAEGLLHEHGEFLLDGGGTAPPPGVYAAALELQVEGLEPSAPVVVVIAHDVEGEQAMMAAEQTAADLVAESTDETPTASSCSAAPRGDRAPSWWLAVLIATGCLRRKDRSR